MTERLAADPAGIARAAALLRDGRLVAFPTDTVYGVACATAHPEAVDDIFALKRRPIDRLIPILVDGLESIGAEWSVDERARRIAAAHWPGALTLVLHGPEGRSQAFRAPAHAVALALIGSAGALYTTSANVSDEPETLDADDVLIAFATQADGLAAVVDGGRVPGGVASTVVDLADGPARILRQGPIGREELARIVELRP
ncbi:MAG TPA: L-threonylcarbamoyladenylate synthase [Candidatus Limnocylindria bacterium]